MATTQSKPSTALGTAGSLSGRRLLAYTALFYAVAVAAHTFDHYRRGLDTLTTEVHVTGIVGTVASAIAVALALFRNRYAAPVAVAVGFASALGIAFVHLLPVRSAFSDPFPGSTVDSLSWAVVLLEIAGALAFGAAALYALRGQSMLRAPTDDE